MIATESSVMICIECNGTGEEEFQPGQFRKCLQCHGKSAPVALNLRNIPRRLRDRFKSLCADAGVTMETGAVLLLEAAVNEGEIPIFTGNLVNLTH